ncbi:hypothetical protein D3C73_1301690 [compost metagenome]
MSISTSSISSDLSPIQQRVMSVIQRIRSLMTPPHVSDWYVNATGNFAVRAQVVCGDDGTVRARLTLRQGWYNNAYSYSSLQIELPGQANKRQKAFRLACQQAEHLTKLRYRF